jgi:adenylylsulfate kinase
MSKSDHFLLWLQGPTSSGKSTIAQAYVDRLRAAGLPVIHYDGDEVRDFFGRDFGFHDANRLKVVSTLVHLAGKASEAGMNVIVSALTANEDARELVRTDLPQATHGYVKCNIETCAARDPKGLYARAKAGEIDTLIGWSTPYTPPLCPDIVLDTDTQSVESLLDQLDRELLGRLTV